MMLGSISDSSGVSSLVATAANEYDARLTPSGTYLSYTSDESGRTQVYVTAFPNVGARTAVSVGAGSLARWRRDGRVGDGDVADEFCFAGYFVDAVDARNTVPDVLELSLRHAVSESEIIHRP